jgi:hypothetical protein
MFDTFWQDVRFGVRTLAKNPGFTAVAVTALALGIGANATVFSLVNAILFKNLPFDRNDRILYLSSADLRSGRVTGGISYPDYSDLRDQTKSFTALAAYTRCLGNFSDDLAFPESYRCAQVTAGAFTVMGQQPILGRDFLPGDERPGATPSVILTYGLWEKRYGKDPSIVGRTIYVNSVPSTVIGVMPKGIAFPSETQFWQSMPAASPAASPRNSPTPIAIPASAFNASTNKPSPTGYAGSSSPSSAPSDLSSSSPVPTSPICFSPAPSAVLTKSLSAPLSAPDAGAWFASCSSKAFCSHPPAACSAG